LPESGSRIRSMFSSDKILNKFQLIKWTLRLQEKLFPLWNFPFFFLFWGPFWPACIRIRRRRGFFGTVNFPQINVISTKIFLKISRYDTRYQHAGISEWSQRQAKLGHLKFCETDRAH
jgi:hypothetical protein